MTLKLYPIRIQTILFTLADDPYSKRHEFIF